MLHWAIIGSGDVVNRLVGKSFLIPQKSRVKYIFSTNFKSANELAKKHKLGKAVKNLNTIIKDKEINSVYIATPHNTHFNYIKKFANAKKNILCEKPLVIKKQHIGLVKKICKRNKVSLVTLFYRRHLKRFKYIKKLLSKKKLGKIVYFKVTLTVSPDKHPVAPIYLNKLNKKNIPWRFKKKQSGGGNFVDMGAHAIDIIPFLLGDINKVYSIKKNYAKYYDVEDTIITNIELKNGIVGQGVWSSITQKNIDFFEIFGTKGYIKFSMHFSDLVEITTGIKYKNYLIDENGMKVANIQINALK